MDNKRSRRILFSFIPVQLFVLMVLKGFDVHRLVETAAEWSLTDELSCAYRDCGTNRRTQEHRGSEALQVIYTVCDAVRHLSYCKKDGCLPHSERSIVSWNLNQMSQYVFVISCFKWEDK